MCYLLNAEYPFGKCLIIKNQILSKASLKKLLNLAIVILLEIQKEEDMKIVLGQLKNYFVDCSTLIQKQELGIKN